MGDTIEFPRHLAGYSEHANCWVCNCGSYKFMLLEDGRCVCTECDQIVNGMTAMHGRD